MDCWYCHIGYMDEEGKVENHFYCHRIRDVFTALYRSFNCPEFVTAPKTKAKGIGTQSPAQEKEQVTVRAY